MHLQCVESRTNRVYNVIHVSQALKPPTVGAGPVPARLHAACTSAMTLNYSKKITQWFKEHRSEENDALLRTFMEEGVAEVGAEIADYLFVLLRLT